MIIGRADTHSVEKAPDEAKLEIPENVPGAEDKAEEQPRKPHRENK